MFCLIRELIRPYPVTCYGGCRLKTPTRLSIFSEERGKSQECNLAGVLGRDIGYGSDTNIYPCRQAARRSEPHCARPILCRPAAIFSQPHSET